MSKTENELRTELKIEYQEAVATRGESFIRAAALIVDNLTEVQIRKINEEFKDGLPLTFPPGYLERDENKGKSPYELLKGYLEQTQNFWEDPNHWATVQRRIDKVGEEQAAKEKKPEKQDKARRAANKEELFAEISSLEDMLIKAISDVVYFDVESDDKKKYKKVKDELDNAENHASWKHREVKGMVIDFTEPFDGKASAPIRKKHDQAKYQSGINGQEKFLGQIKRKETPIERFTDEQTYEWLTITGKTSQPDWFKKLADWEQRYFVNEVEHYKTVVTKLTDVRNLIALQVDDPNDIPDWFKELNEKQQQLVLDKVGEYAEKMGSGGRRQAMTSEKTGIEINLGEFLGTVPTTIRRYPGAPNGFVTEVNIPSEHVGGGITFKKVRTGLVAPPKAPNKKEATRIARQNIEQIMAVAIQEKIISEVQRLGEASGGKEINIPVLLQTLHSSPLQPDGGLSALTGGQSQAAIYKALDEIRDSIKKDGVDAFLDKHHIDKKGMKVGQVDLCYSNRPVNTARGIATFRNFFSPRYQRENANSVKVLSDRLKEMEKETPRHPQLDMAKAALERLEKKPYMINTLFGPFRKKINPMAERAALEQVVADVAGMRVGSCVSGKDREEMVTEIAIAQMSFFAKNGKFPPDEPRFGSLSTEDKAARVEYAKMVARQYLSGYGQELAGENSPGCDGLKNVEDVLSVEICEHIKGLAPEYGIDPAKFDPVKGVQDVAGLNKINVKKLQKNRHENFIGMVMAKISGPVKNLHEHHRGFDEEESTPERPICNIQRISDDLLKKSQNIRKNFNRKGVKQKEELTKGESRNLGILRQHGRKKDVAFESDVIDRVRQDMKKEFQQDLNEKFGALLEKAGKMSTLSILGDKVVGLILHSMTPQQNIADMMDSLVREYKERGGDTFAEFEAVMIELEKIQQAFEERMELPADGGSRLEALHAAKAGRMTQDLRKHVKDNFKDKIIEKFEVFQKDIYIGSKMGLEKDSLNTLFDHAIDPSKALGATIERIDAMNKEGKFDRTPEVKQAYSNLRELLIGAKKEWDTGMEQIKPAQQTKASHK